MAMYPCLSLPSLSFPTLTGSIVTFNSQYAGLPLKAHTVDIDSVSGVSTINIGSDNKYAGFINFNQLVRNERIGQTTLSMPDNRTIVVSTNSIKSIPNHIYFISCNVTADTTSKGLYVQFGNTINFGQGIGVKNVIYVGLTELSYVYVYIRADEASGVTATYKDFCIFDLTQMFGSTKADEIYQMEQQTAGSGVVYVRSLFPNDYYDYNAGTLSTVSAVNGSTNSFFTIPIGQTVNEGEYDARTGILEVTAPSEQTIQLPPCPIDTLEGVNNIWADTGDTTLQYPKFG